jgi:hypothetical protein
VLEYRVTKYDPALRDLDGRYLREEWTSAGDIGRLFDGVVLTREEYLRVEDAHVETVLAFLREAGCGCLLAVGVENHGGSPSAPAEADRQAGAQLGETIRRLLRGEFWCRLEGNGCFLHVGYDYYLYVGVPSPCPQAYLLASHLGLFVEEFASPYRWRA